MAKKNMRNGILLLQLLLCNIFGVFISQFHFGYATKHSSSHHHNNKNFTSCIASESRALLEFKASLVDRANRLASWIAGEDCCSWYGITCNPLTGHVEKLLLGNPIHWDGYGDINHVHLYINNSLGGEINPSILNLEHLSHLDLSSNDFSPIQIPSFLGSFKYLRYLNLTDAGFSGEIPAHLGNLSNLQTLSMGSVFLVNSLTAKSLKWLMGLPSLKALDLSHTNLTHSLDWMYSISMLPSLSSLSLRGCDLVLTNLSPPLSPILNLTSLVSLDLGDNYHMTNSSILLPLLNLTTQLAVLRLDGNELQGPIPITSEQFSSLVELDLSYNYFDSPSVLDSLCNNTNLLHLDLTSNQFQGSLPPCLGNLTSLRVLNLAGNKFGGKLPSELGHLKHLTTLDLSGTVLKFSIRSHVVLRKQDLSAGNVFKSSIPSSFGLLSKLEHLDLSYNHIKSSIPSNIGQLSMLEYLDFSNNDLTGELSESHFAKLKNLKYFYISNNLFLSFNVTSQWVPPFQLRQMYMDSVHIGSPQFPPWFQTQRQVVDLSLNNASISGVLPAWFTSWSSIYRLSLSNNNIQGASISFPPNIQILDLSNNFLTDVCPFHTNCMANSSSSLSLSLNDNHLAGNILDHFCSLRSLSALSLANNQLTGRIPLCFGNLTGLEVLDLANNSLSGHIPRTLGNLPLFILNLARNNLSGVFPSSLKNLLVLDPNKTYPGLQHLDLGENQLTGTIPDWIGKNISSLHFLRLESNNFHGNISQHLCGLSSLQILNLAENNLVGHIPYCFGNLTMMRSNPPQGYSVFDGYTETLWNSMKGIEREYYIQSLTYAKFISLSTNNLQGEIPNELLDLDGLQSLNLSNNKLSGRIPENIDNLKNLESLDLAMNQLSGPIPQSLANIDSLSYLNLSFNNLTGRIPSGSHFDTLSNPSIYEGNIGLCGKPLVNKCPDDPKSEGGGVVFNENMDEGFVVSWFYSGIAPGFAAGSVGVFCILYFKKSWRQAYFGFVESIYDRVWVAFFVNISQFFQKFN